MDFISFFLQLQNKEIPDHVLILVPFVKKIGTKDIQNCSRWKQQTNEKNTFLLIRSTRSRAWKGVSGRKKKGKLFFTVEERIVIGDKDLKFFCKREEGYARWRND